MDPIKHLRQSLHGRKPGEIARRNLIALVGFHGGCHWAFEGEAAAIINESNADCGENVGGGATSAPAAPEVAAADDGDGDGDPDPERRRSGRPSNTRNSLPSTVEHFDRLPDSACIDIAALKAITGKSRATLYRWIDKGILPKPRKLGLTSNNVWAAGDIRRALSA